jgi:ferredoxin-thioredoxin reductase catalytic chain
VNVMNDEQRKKALQDQFGPVVDVLGYKFTPDSELVTDLLDAEVMLMQRTGIPFCPCQGRTRDRKKDMKIVCPCIPFHKAHFDAMKRCWCGLFVHKDVTDPSTLRQIPPEEIGGLGK